MPTTARLRVNGAITRRLGSGIGPSLYGSKSLVGVLIFAVPVSGGKLARRIGLATLIDMCTATARGKTARDQDFASEQGEDDLLPSGMTQHGYSHDRRPDGLIYRSPLIPARHARPCAGHPRLGFRRSKTWM